MLLSVTDEEIVERMRFDNPWWVAGGSVDKFFRDMPRRDYFPPFSDLVTQRQIRRAVILLGPRRVGKTVLVYQSIDQLIAQGHKPERLLYLSLETPLYSGLPLEKLLRMFMSACQHGTDTPLTVFFDEIQYLRDWEVHLKSLVDSYPSIKFVATGSAAAALRLKSRESGAGRFTDFLLPPLTFCEYLRFTGIEPSVIIESDTEEEYATKDINQLNIAFVEYLNYGGYPEAVFDKNIRADSARYIKSDIIDKVLLRDLPSLYGIQDIQELNRLFLTLAYNTGNEVALEGLSRNSGVAKNTIKRYVEYLEAAFLIRRVYRVDQSARRFERENSFKVYLTNPTMRTALFGPIKDTDTNMGALTETAVFSQWFHSPDSTNRLHYARWKTGEIDIVHCDPALQKPDWIVEVKWSDRPVSDESLRANSVAFAKRHPLKEAPLITTKTYNGKMTQDGITIIFTPSSLYSYILGKNTVAAAGRKSSGVEEEKPNQLNLDITTN